MLLKLLLLTASYLLSGCLTDVFLGTKAQTGYSTKTYSVKNGFGKHRYTPDKRYRVNPKYRIGSASYYGGKFNGRKTASLVIFDESQLTAAHPTAVLPSIAKVTRLDNNKSVYVIITDRGPFAKNRICDLSVAAAKRLDIGRIGHAKVKIHILEKESEILAKHWKKFQHKRLPKDLFRHISSAKALKNYLQRVR